MQRNRKIGSIITTRKGCATFDSRFLIIHANCEVKKILTFAFILLHKFKKLGPQTAAMSSEGRPRQIGCDSRLGRSLVACDDYEYAFSFLTNAWLGKAFKKQDGTPSVLPH